MRRNDLNIITEHIYILKKPKKYYYHKMILKLKIEILTLGSNWTKNQEHWEPIEEACCGEVSTGLVVLAGTSTRHDRPFLRFLSEKQ